MAINWFPGHMNKARRELRQAVARVDVAIELLDARLPHSSRNPMLGELLGEKPRLVLLNKSDLADPGVTRRWLHRLNGVQPAPCLEFVASRPQAGKPVLATCRRLAPHRSGAGKSVRVMVLGIPNVGKSTLINSLLGRRVAKVEDRPAVTRSQRSFQLEGGIRLSDTPGVLWPRLADQTGARRLATSGAIRETAFDVVEMALFAIGFLTERYKEAFSARFDLERADAEPEALLEAIGRRRGLLRRGNEVDVERAATLLLQELRSGRIGRLSFETPEDFEADE